jgi:hypothetical protein
LLALFASACAVSALAAPTRIAFLDLGNTEIGRAAAERLSKQVAKSPDIVVMDRDQAKTAAAGAGYAGSLNLSLAEARDIGSAIGCDFFIVGDADTLRRSPSTGPIYFESYASIFVVSARTGRLVFWQRPSANKASAAESEKTLFDLLSSDELLQSLVSSIRKTTESEQAERAARVENALPVIEVMSDETAEADNSTRPPRPFRRVKPEYTEAASHSRVEAIVDALADIDEKGEATHVEIARWAGYGLDESVIGAVKQMHFFPAMRDRRAIPMRVLLRYNFRKPPPQ